MKVICSICIEDITEPVSLACGHVFDKKCIQSHFCHSSPLCPHCKYDCHDYSFKTLYLSTVEPDEKELESLHIKEATDRADQSLVDLVDDLKIKLAISESALQATSSDSIQLEEDLTKHMEDIKRKKEQLYQRYQRALRIAQLTCNLINRASSSSHHAATQRNDVRPDLKEAFKSIRRCYKIQRSQLFLAKVTSMRISRKIKNFEELTNQVDLEAIENPGQQGWVVL
ncbi:MAG: hypothetical protein EXX96DRAFT_581033 [Benjaminiella poitrasii]|nr:MAG: hypothetical protein EXX96DRAFT_581033 [Benjaminiella poitrasii]